MLPSRVYSSPIEAPGIHLKYVAYQLPLDIIGQISMPTEELLVTVVKAVGVLNMTSNRHIRNSMLSTWFIQYLFLFVENVACAIGSSGL